MSLAIPRHINPLTDITGGAPNQTSWALWLTTVRTRIHLDPWRNGVDHRSIDTNTCTQTGWLSDKGRSQRLRCPPTADKHKEYSRCNLCGAGRYEVWYKKGQHYEDVYINNPYVPHRTKSGRSRPRSFISYIQQPAWQIISVYNETTYTTYLLPQDQRRIRTRHSEWHHARITNSGYKQYMNEEQRSYVLTLFEGPAVAGR